MDDRTMKAMLASAAALALLTGCAHGPTPQQQSEMAQRRAALASAVESCKAQYPFAQGTAVKRISCLRAANTAHGNIPPAGGPVAGLVAYIAMMSEQVDAGTINPAAALIAIQQQTNVAQQQWEAGRAQQQAEQAQARAFQMQRSDALLNFSAQMLRGPQQNTTNCSPDGIGGFSCRSW
jgi:hypothetical protein